MTHPAFQRSELLIGQRAQARLAQTRVILFGIGGVGSWCAEALVRSGLQQLTLVDSDLVCVTNINRQVQATRTTVGSPKVEVLRARLLELNPAADIAIRQQVYDGSSCDSFDLAGYDFVIDAVDSLSAKLGLIEQAMASGSVLLSAMGASAKLDPTRIQVSSIWRTRNCPLARKLRKRLRRHGVEGDCLCVHSDELLPNHEAAIACGSGRCHCPRFSRGEDGEPVPAHEWCSSKKHINGSMVHVTATFGMVLAGLVIQEVVRRAELETSADATAAPDLDPRGIPSP